MRKSVIGSKKFDYLVVDKINETGKRSKYLVKCDICGEVKETYNLSKVVMSHSIISCRNNFLNSFLGKVYNDFTVIRSYSKGRHFVDARCCVCGIVRKNIAMKDFETHKNLHSKHCTLLNTKRFPDKRLLRKLHRTYQNAKNRCTNPKTPGKYYGRDFGFEDSVDFITFLYDDLQEFSKMSGLSLKDISLDRIDNTKGYIKGNLQWLSVSENARKGTK